jgi:hypothetical protein
VVSTRAHRDDPYCFCYARATHPYLGLNPGEDFPTRIFVKTNKPKVLRRELARSSWTGEPVAVHYLVSTAHVAQPWTSRSRRRSSFPWRRPRPPHLR